MVADCEGFFLVVGHQNRAGATGLEDVPHLMAQATTQFAIEVGKGFVQQQQLRFRCQCAGNGNALLLATGELVRVALAGLGQADQRQHLGAARPPCRAIQAAQPEGLHLPLPHDRRLRRMPNALCEQPQLQARLADWAQRIGMSERSMTRLFLAETGLTVNQWRRQLHVLTALQKLSEGLRIQTVADALGYESAPAFVTMFRKAVGTSPRRFLALRSAPVAGGAAGL